MTTISNSVSVAANTRSGNVLSGEQFEFLTRPSLIVLSMTAAAIGVQCDFNIGGDTVVVAGDISDRKDQSLSTQQGFPNSERDEIASASGQAGERLFLDFNNTTGAALIVKFLVEIQQQ